MKKWLIAALTALPLSGCAAAPPPGTPPSSPSSSAERRALPEVPGQFGAYLFSNGQLEQAVARCESESSERAHQRALIEERGEVAWNGTTSFLRQLECAEYHQEAQLRGLR